MSFSNFPFKRLLAIPALILLSLTPVEGMAEDYDAPTIIHNPVMSFSVIREIPIEAEVDDDSGLKEVSLYFRKSRESDYEKRVMFKEGETTYKSIIPKNFISSAGIDYYIEAVDNAGNRSTEGGTTHPIKIMMRAATKATINHIPIKSVPEGTPLVVISANISDDKGLKEINLFYRGVTGGRYKKSPMNNISESAYMGDIPGNDYPQGFEYYIEAIDSLNRSIYSGNAGIPYRVKLDKSAKGDSPHGKKAEPRYVGSSQCKVCHRIWWNSWRNTGMANDYDLLKPGSRYRAKIKAGLDPDFDYRKTPKCLSCHTVGFDKPGGYNLDMPRKVAEEKGLLGVGCEMCHGPGGNFWPLMPRFKKGELREKDLVAAGLNLPGRTDKGDICIRNCHNKKNPFWQPFDFVERVSRDTRFGGKGIHEHYELRSLNNFGGKHDYPLQVDVRYIYKSRKGAEKKHLGQPQDFTEK